MWIQTLIGLSHLLVILNSSVNFYIYLVKLHIMYDTIANCCHEERKILSHKTRKENLTKEVGNEILENEAKEPSSQEIVRNRGEENKHQENFRLSTIYQQVPDIIQSSISD